MKIEVKYPKEEVENLIKNYYQQYEGRDVTVTSKASRDFVGIYEDEVASVDISIAEKISLLGVTTTLKEQIDKDQLTLIFDKLFESTDYNLKGLRYDASLEKKWDFQGSTENIPCFRGIILTIERKVNNKPSCYSQDNPPFEESITTSQGSLQKKLGTQPTHSFIDHGNNEVSFIPY